MSYKKVITLNLDYSQFKGGIKDINAEMRVTESSFKAASAEIDTHTNFLNKNKMSNEKLRLEQEKLQAQIQLATQKVAMNKEALDKATESGDASRRQLAKLQTEYNNSVTQLEKLNKKLEDNKVALSNVKTTMTEAITMFAAMSAAALKLATDVAKTADDICTLSTNTGISTETLQKWQYAADAVDISAEDITSSLRKMVNNMDSAATGSGTAYEAFKKLGLSVTDASGNLKDSETMFYEVVDALGKVENKTQADAIAMDIFGKSAQDLSGVVKAGSAGMKELGDEAERLGVVISDDALHSAADFNDKLGEMQTVLESAGAQIGLAILPLLTDLVTVIASIPAPVLRTIAVIASIIASIVMVVRVIKSVSDAGGAVKTALQMFNEVEGKKTIITIMAIVAAITALVTAIVVLCGKSKELNQTMSNISKSTNNIASTNKQSTGYNASGTKNWSGGPTWVGENGPEIADLPPGTRIYSNQESKSIMGDTNVFYVSVDAASIEDVQRMMNVFNGIKQSRGRGGKVNG